MVKHPIFGNSVAKFRGNAILGEVLDCATEKEKVYFRNYEEWSFQMKTYLLSQDLWDDVIVRRKGPKALCNNNSYYYKMIKKKDAAALHAIQMSCNTKALSLIMGKTRAKAAWSALKSLYEEEIIRRDQEKSEEDQSNTSEGEENDETEQETEQGTSDSEYSSSSGRDDDEQLKYRPFFNDVIAGKWNKVEEFIKENMKEKNNAMKVTMPGSGKNALHVAISAGQLHIVKELVNIMSDEELKIKRKDDLTVLHAAVEIGNIEIAQCLVNKQKDLLTFCSKIVKIESHPKEISRFKRKKIIGSESDDDMDEKQIMSYSPVVLAVIYGQIQMAHYLYQQTPKEFLCEHNDGFHGSALITQCIYKKYFDIALDLMKGHPRLGLVKDEFNRNPLYVLASTPQQIPNVNNWRFWEKYIYEHYIQIPSAGDYVYVDITTSVLGIVQPQKSPFGQLLRVASFLNILDMKGLYETKLGYTQCDELQNLMCIEIEKMMSEKEIRNARVCDAVEKAAKNGNVEFITKITRANPELIWSSEVATNVFENAIESREPKVFSLIYGLHDKEALAHFVHKRSRFTMLHMVAQEAPSQVRNLIPGSALQMQKELQWFKEVESFAGQVAEYEDRDKEKPKDRFTRNHKQLMINGEIWMKATSQSCTIVGALIVTIMFTAAFTVPGGNNQDSGYPIFLNKILFKIFMSSDAISLFSSTTSVLMFLSILTSRYTEEDFLYSLPNKMIIGLCTLILSLLTMMIAFCATLSIMFQAQLWILVPVTSFASIPVLFFIWVQSRPLRQMIMSTYGPSIFDRNVKPWLYNNDG